ncbi:MAG: triose-phosphate isomerase [Dehalococcoides mccartyi]|uniref:Triosephosphate isomerase n=2 Tax=root TaxID=1 RepID=A0AB33HXH3_9CHLR|nr:MULTISPECIES: triose-phosphate isomerase [Dehalococcoides]AII59374.1 triosephosphate isomerase [Dehalococcoides mccartyi CG4]MBF4482855.1 triose-phosphate isomerase [Dehalococcoides mccartyi]MBJ7532145.1 triose-phosphate isomerase [Dehalococcoides mccartyi]MDP4280067.1 triose-phosphate isomerase [Dehalococcoides mccartyi]MEA4879315.1 triose-phosphate isomerase [Dehalococcoides mccartyi]
MRQIIIAGNWKMNTTLSEACTLVQGMKDELDQISGIQKIVCPPFISLAPVKTILDGSSIQLGAQNLFYEEKGAYTGEISPLMLQDICPYVIIGHSERRAYFGETGQVVNRKIKAALQAGIMPIVCVGEKLEENENGQTRQILETQLKEALAGINPSSIIIAYEPIWAIGTGKAATAAEANNTISYIRKVLGDIWGNTASQTTPILYGGSVNEKNTAELLCQPDIDGALVGGASLKAESFVSICRQAADVRK